MGYFGDQFIVRTEEADAARSRSAAAFDEAAFARHFSIFDDGERLLFREAFLCMSCQTVPPPGEDCPPFGPEAILDLVQAAAVRGNGGYAYAVCHLVDGRWAAVDLRSDDTLGHLLIHDAHAYVGDELLDVLRFGVDESGREAMGLPGPGLALDRWATDMSTGRLSSISTLGTLLAGCPAWFDVTMTLDWSGEDGPAGVPEFRGPEITSVQWEAHDEGESTFLVTLLDDRWGLLDIAWYRTSFGDAFARHVRSAAGASPGEVLIAGSDGQRRATLGLGDDAAITSWERQFVHDSP